MALGLSLMHKDAEASGSRNVFPRLAAKQFATLIGKFTKSRAIRLYGPSCRTLKLISGQINLFSSQIDLPSLSILPDF